MTRRFSDAQKMTPQFVWLESSAWRAFRACDQTALHKWVLWVGVLSTVSPSLQSQSWHVLLGIPLRLRTPNCAECSSSRLRSPVASESPGVVGRLRSASRSLIAFAIRSLFCFGVALTGLSSEDSTVFWHRGKRGAYRLNNNEITVRKCVVCHQVEQLQKVGPSVSLGSPFFHTVSCCVVLTYLFLIVVSGLILSYKQSRSTLWVRDTWDKWFPLMNCFIAASFSLNTKSLIWAVKSFVFDDTKSRFADSSWIWFAVCFVRMGSSSALECNTWKTASHNLSARISSVRTPRSSDIMSNSVRSFAPYLPRLSEEICPRSKISCDVRILEWLQFAFNRIMINMLNTVCIWLRGESCLSILLIFCIKIGFMKWLFVSTFTVDQVVRSEISAFQHHLESGLWQFSHCRHIFWIDLMIIETSVDTWSTVFTRQSPSVFITVSSISFNNRTPSIYAIVVSSF